MVALRVLMLVEDALPVISAAATMAFAGASTPPPAPGSPSPGPGAPPPAPGAPTPAAPSAALGGTINLPPQMQLDDTFAPVPMRTQSAGQALAAAGFAMAAPAASPGSVGPGAYVVRGLIDAADLDAVTRATQGPGGQT